MRDGNTHKTIILGRQLSNMKSYSCNICNRRSSNALKKREVVNQSFCFITNNCSFFSTKLTIQSFLFNGRVSTEVWGVNKLFHMQYTIFWLIWIFFRKPVFTLIARMTIFLHNYHKTYRHTHQIKWLHGKVMIALQLLFLLISEFEEKRYIRHYKKLINENNLCVELGVIIPNTLKMCNI